MNIKNMLEDIKNKSKLHINESLDEIMYNSRQNEIGELSPWFEALFRGNVGKSIWHSYGMEDHFYEHLIDETIIYLTDNKIKNVVIGVSGGADSSVSLAMLKEIQNRIDDFKVFPYYIKISNEHGIENAKDVCKHLGYDLELVDMTDTFNFMIKNDNIGDNPTRQGNIRARLRMMYLYDKAHFHNGIVIGNSNFSEFMAGFWTLQGDVADLNPMEGLYKSSEITNFGKYLGLPERFWRETPSDGLDITDKNTDEDQIGMSYLEFDILTSLYIHATTLTSFVLEDKFDYEQSDFKEIFDEEYIMTSAKKIVSEATGAYMTNEDETKLKLFYDRINKNRYKRKGTVSIDSYQTSKLHMIRICDDFYQ